MADRRSRREKLKAMAADKSSPSEAAIAQEKLNALPDDVADPHRYDHTFEYEEFNIEYTPYTDFYKKWTADHVRVKRPSGNLYTEEPIDPKVAETAKSYNERVWSSLHKESAESKCPGCRHTTVFHSGGFCYRCVNGSCGYSYVGVGNPWTGQAGWLSKKDMVK